MRYSKLFLDEVKFLEDCSEYETVISMQNVEKYYQDWIYEYGKDIVPGVKKIFIDAGSCAKDDP